ncbi:hypothetical protein K469DRAFT_712271 [Zopfia rhizophila CBS 207.26]|uniref:Uncharacterized protein n=1 Tax=Zopfia rhizophila CBS 207.26 TaxID=1314779 RepID=A0A6A6EPK3_9PEZI|nr:hypothetical protein K469DRAFT_712271 [Zopfia rhizophila CBS 207.26]
MLTRRLLSTATSLRVAPLTWVSLQRGGLRYQHQDVKAPYTKGEKVDKKRFQQFDLAGGTFVVTGAHHVLTLRAVTA